MVDYGVLDIFRVSADIDDGDCDVQNDHDMTMHYDALWCILWFYGKMFEFQVLHGGHSEPQCPGHLDPEAGCDQGE